jgi:hypothetical protein
MINWEERYRTAEVAFQKLKNMTKQVPADEWSMEYRDLANAIHTLGRDVFYMEPLLDKIPCTECGKTRKAHYDNVYCYAANVLRENVVHVVPWKAYEFTTE